MADNSGGGAGPVAVVAIVVLVGLAVVAGGMWVGHGGSPTHAISGAVSTPSGPISGQVSGH